MASVESSAVVPIPPDLAFAVSQTTGEVRYRWDPFVHEQRFLQGASVPGKGVRTYTRQRFGLSMESEYVAFAPPTNVGMKMVTGPWFFDMFGGGWRFTPIGDGSSTRVVWRYSFRCRPAWLRPGAEAIGRVVLGREIRRRLAGYVRGCADEVVLAAARSALDAG